MVLQKKIIYSSIISKLHKKNSYALKSSGISMLPLLRDKDIVYFRRTPFKKLHIDDILVVSRKNYTFAHRIVYIGKNYVITKGDNNSLSDGKIYEKDILGKVYEVKRNNKKVLLENIYLIQSSLYLPEILNTVRAFNENNVDYLILKGLPLHLYYQKKYPTRLYADCDLLISDIHYDKAIKLLRETGYSQINTSISPFKSVAEAPAEVSYSKNKYGLPVVFDVHKEPVFMMTQIRRLDALYSQDKVAKMGKELLEHKRYISLRGYRIPILAPEHLIIYLALHFFHHNYKGMFRLDLLHAVIKKETALRQQKSFEKIASFIDTYSLATYIYPVCKISLYWFSDLSILKKIQKSIKFPLVGHMFIDTNKMSIFSEENRMSAGINRFLFLLVLSPQPLWKRLFLLFNVEVWYFIFFTIFNKFGELMRRTFKRYVLRKSFLQLFYS